MDRTQPGLIDYIESTQIIVLQQHFILSTGLAGRPKLVAGPSLLQTIEEFAIT